MSEALGKLADIHYGRSPAPVLAQDGAIPVYGTGGVYGKARMSLFPGPAIVVPRKGSLGNPSYVPTPFWPSDTTYALVPRSGVDAKWLFYNLDRYDLTRLNEATGVPSISRDWLARIQFQRPDSNTQRRIATILTTLDEVIEATEKLVEKHQQIKAGLMHDLFTRGVSPDGNLRPTSEARQSKFGWIPKSWKVGSLLNVASSTRQPILTGPFGADLGTDDFVEAGVPLLRIGNVQTGRLDLENLLFVSERKAGLLDRYRVRKGDLLFARQGATTGRNTLATAEVEGWLINYHIIRVALDHSLCSPFFIETAFNSDVVKRQIERDKGRGTREGINSAQLRGLELPLADFQEQQMIAQILGNSQSLLKRSQDNLAKLRQQKQGLMHDLLTGRVRVDGECAGEVGKI